MNTEQLRHLARRFVNRSGLPDFGWERSLIVIKAILSMCAVFYPVWWVHLRFTYNKLPSLPLSLAVSFLGVQIAIILLQLFASMAVKKLDAIGKRRSEHWKSLIEPLLAGQVAGENHIKELRKLRRRRPTDFDSCVASSLATLEGPEREAMSRLAFTLGVVRRWQRLARKGRQERKQAIEWMTFLAPSVGREALGPLLDNQTPALQATLYRALIKVARNGEMSDLFLRTLHAPYFVRALLAGEFRPFAEDLAPKALSAALNSGDDEEIISALEMVDSWRRALYLPQLEALTRHPNPEIRSRALRAAPVSAVRGGMEQAVVGAIGDSHTQVKLAALTAAARMQIRGALQAVEQAAYSVDNAVSRLACLVLASFGKEGRWILEYMVITCDRRVGGWAAEALGQASVGKALGMEF